MSFDGETLFRLLPAVHRTRDLEIAAGLGDLLTDRQRKELAALEDLASPSEAEQNRRAELRDLAIRGPLRALLGVFAGEIGVLEENLDQLYDDLFVETCADWVLPYIGDLIGYRTLHGRAPAGDRRAEVAHTIAFRRRKGTLAMLEQLAFDVTGWRARAVEFFQLLGTTQYLNHRRLHNVVTPDLRRGRELERIGTAFDSIPRTLEVRRVASGRGRYNIPNLGVFLWRLDAQRRGASPPAPHPGDATGLRFRFSALGNDAPLHTRPADETSISHLAGPLNVPAPITRRALSHEKESFYGASASIAVWFDGNLFPVEHIRCCHLGDAPGGRWAHTAPSNTVAIDPVLGRLALADDIPMPNSLRVTWHEAGPADFAGGPYARRRTFRVNAEDIARVPDDHATIQAAIAAIGGGGVVEIVDSGTYRETITIDVAPSKSIEIRAAEGARPLLELVGPASVTGGPGSAAILNGLLIAGDALEVPAAGHTLARLEIRHCTLVPGRALAADGTARDPGRPSVVIRRRGTRLVVERSIFGAIQIDPECTSELTDAIVDAGDRRVAAWEAPDSAGPGGRAGFEGCTVIGVVRCITLDASNSIFFSPTAAVRLQEGCVRFSYLPEGSVAPRRHRCVPDPDPSPYAAPSFTTLRYGSRGYARLTGRTPAAIRRGGEEETEIGAFHYLYEPQRESDLRIRLEEYLRVGLEAGVFHES